MNIIEDDELIIVRLSTNDASKVVKPMGMSIDIPKTMSDEEYLDSIDISNEMILLERIRLCGSYENYKAFRKMVGDLVMELLNKSEN